MEDGRKVYKNAGIGFKQLFLLFIAVTILLYISISILNIIDLYFLDISAESNGWFSSAILITALGVSVVICLVTVLKYKSYGCYFERNKLIFIRNQKIVGKFNLISIYNIQINENKLLNIKTVCIYHVRPNCYSCIFFKIEQIKEISDFFKELLEQTNHKNLTLKEFNNRYKLFLKINRKWYSHLLYIVVIFLLQLINNILFDGYETLITLSLLFILHIYYNNIIMYLKTRK